MKLNRIVLAAALAVLSTFTAITPANLHAQTNADIAKNAFQVSVTININNFTYTPIPIPAGKRLVVQSVNLSGAAAANPYVQPIVMVGATLGSGPTNFHYFGPSVSTTDPTQFYGDYQTTIYADTLEVGPAFAGFTPDYLVFNVVVTGYLVDLPT
jgi:hypothetical protein